MFAPKNSALRVLLSSANLTFDQLLEDTELLDWVGGVGRAAQAPAERRFPVGAASLGGKYRCRLGVGHGLRRLAATVVRQ